MTFHHYSPLSKQRRLEKTIGLPIQTISTTSTLIHLRNFLNSAGCVWSIEWLHFQWSGSYYWGTTMFLIENLGHDAITRGLSLTCPSPQNIDVRFIQDWQR